MIEHYMKNNQIIFRAKLTLRKKITDKEVMIDHSSIERYIKENNILVGNPLNTRQVAGNWKRELLEAEWSYEIAKEAKKNLIKVTKSDTIISEPKKLSPRTRAKKITTAKRASKEKLNEQTNIEEPLPTTTRRTRKKP